MAHPELQCGAIVTTSDKVTMLYKWSRQCLSIHSRVLHEHVGGRCIVRDDGEQDGGCAVVG